MTKKKQKSITLQHLSGSIIIRSQGFDISESGLLYDIEELPYVGDVWDDECELSIHGRTPMYMFSDFQKAEIQSIISNYFPLFKIERI